MGKKIILLLSISALSGIIYGNNDCKVLAPNLNKEYKGECKKGLAHGQGQAWGDDDTYQGYFKKGYPHGKGTYTWKDGSTYTGEFSKGKMDGEGELTIVDASGNKQVKKGFFKKGIYIGISKTPYKIISQQGIRSINFQENSANLNEVRLNIFNNGSKFIPSDLTIRDDNNTIVETRNGTVTLINAQFPLNRISVSFSIDSINYQLIFDIYKAGTWEIMISI